jgi:segregation and condensation protein A
VDLVRVFQAVLERRKEEVKIELHRETFTVGQMMEKLRTQLVLNDAPVSLTGFFEACPSKHAMIVAFLAVLEMVRMQVVLLVQEKLFEDVMLRKRKMFDVVFATKGNGIAQIDEQYL